MFAIVARIEPNGKHGPYAITYSRCSEIRGQMVTFSLFAPCWQEETLPEGGVIVILSDVQRKKAGWRAQHARYVRSGDEARVRQYERDLAEGNICIAQSPKIEDAMAELIRPGVPIDFKEFVGALTGTGKLRQIPVSEILFWLALHRQDLVFPKEDQGTVEVNNSQCPETTTNRITNSQKLGVEQFIALAIEQLSGVDRRPVHTVNSGFNNAFYRYFKDEGIHPETEIERMVKEGKLFCRYVSDGVLISQEPFFDTADIS